MKGVVLAGGSGSRLDPLTRVTNKHLLPVYDKPMIYYPLKTLQDMGLEEVMIVTGDKSAGEIMRLLGNGSEFGFKRLNYAFQEGGNLGIANALSLARGFVGNDLVCVILGDNILLGDLKVGAVGGAKVLLHRVKDPGRFGCPVFSYSDRDREEEKFVDNFINPKSMYKIVRIEEKPKEPKSSYAVIGVYFYDSFVFRIIDSLKPSERGEFEITDVNNRYLQEGKLEFDVFEGQWTDAGTFESLYKASKMVRKRGKHE